MCMIITAKTKLYEIDGKMIAKKIFAIKRKGREIYLKPYFLNEYEYCDYKDYKSVKMMQDGNIIIEAEPQTQKIKLYYECGILNDEWKRNISYVKEFYVLNMGLHSYCLTKKVNLFDKEFYINYSKNIISTLVLINPASVQFVVDEDIFSNKVILPNPEELRKIIDILKRYKYEFKGNIKHYKERYSEFYYLIQKR